MTDFVAFNKIPRLRRNIVVTEKLDGTNAQVYIPDDDGPMLVGSRNRWITSDADNYGFARWCAEHEADLRRLGPGRHFGEWWGSGIQRRYGLDHKRFSLFNVGRWKDEPLPSCVSLVPVMYEGAYDDDAIRECLRHLAIHGSIAAPGFMQPEGVVVFHTASQSLYKVTLGDDGHKDAALARGQAVAS